MTPTAMTSVSFEKLAPRFAAMRDYLAGIRNGRAMARLADINPGAIETMLPFINLIDVVLRDDAVRYRFRLVGIAQSVAAQVQYAGRFIDEVIDPASRPRVLEDLTRAVATCMPHYGRYGMPFPGRGFIDSERVFYPLSSDGRMVDCILALHHYPDFDIMPRASDRDWLMLAWAAQRGAI